MRSKPGMYVSNVGTASNWAPLRVRMRAGAVKLASWQMMVPHTPSDGSV